LAAIPPEPRWARKAKGWFLEFRLIPVLLWSYTAVGLGTAVAYFASGSLNALWFLAALALGALIQGWETHAINALDAAMHKLAEPGHVAPDRSKFAIVGYSIGGVLALRLAHRAPGAGLVNLPIPRAVVLQDGAGMNSPAYPFLRLDDLSQIDPNTKLLIIMAEDTYKRRLTEPTQCNYDFLQPWMWLMPACNGFGVSKLAWTRTLQVVTKNAVAIPTDTYGTPDLISEHNGVLVAPSDIPPKPLDAIDWAYWKLTVGALNYAVHGTDGIYAFGAAPELRDMGVWSDGTAVRLIYPIDGCFVGGSCP